MKKIVFPWARKGKNGSDADPLPDIPMTPVVAGQLRELKSLRDQGVEQYQFLAALDDQVCPVCRALDEQVFQTKDARPGYNFPPIHEGCRCSVVSYDPFDKLDAMMSGVVPPTEE